MKVVNVPNIIPLSTVLNTAINSIPLPLYHLFGYSIQLVFTGTPTGSFKLQGSDDPVPQGGAPSITAQPTPLNWTDIKDSTQSVAAAGSVVWNVTSVGYNWVRVVYTDGSGGASTALITDSTFNGKGI